MRAAAVQAGRTAGWLAGWLAHLLLPPRENVQQVCALVCPLARPGGYGGREEAEGGEGTVQIFLRWRGSSHSLCLLLKTPTVVVVIGHQSSWRKQNKLYVQMSR
jgi:hypothetical protein